MYTYVIFLLYPMKHSKQYKKFPRNLYFKGNASFSPGDLYLLYPDSIPDTRMQFYNFYFVVIVHTILGFRKSKLRMCCFSQFCIGCDYWIF